MQKYKIIIHSLTRKQAEIIRNGVTTKPVDILEE